MARAFSSSWREDDSNENESGGSLWDPLPEIEEDDIEWEDDYDYLDVEVDPEDETW
jgi:hypothetical protein